MLNDHERKALRELERLFMADDPEFPRAFDAFAQRLDRTHLGGRPRQAGHIPPLPHAAAVAPAVAER